MGQNFHTTSRTTSLETRMFSSVNGNAFLLAHILNSVVTHIEFTTSGAESALPESGALYLLAFDSLADFGLWSIGRNIEVSIDLWAAYDSLLAVSPPKEPISEIMGLLAVLPNDSEFKAQLIDFVGQLNYI